MSRSASKVDDFLAAHPTLEQGETIVGTARAMPMGGIKAWSKRVGRAGIAGGVGVAFILAKDARSDDRSYEKLAEKGVYLILTNRRLIVTNSSSMAAKPEFVIATVDRARINSVEEGVTKVSLIKILNFTLTLDDETEIGFEFAKPDTSEGRALLEALR